MAGLSISGLASGIDTTSVINSLIAVAAGPQNQLKTQLSTEQNKLAAYQEINTKLTALQAAATALGQAGTWAATSATSTDPSVVVSSSSNALAGSSTTLTVRQLAQSQVSTDAPADPTNVANSANGLSITVGGKTSTVALAGNSAADVVSAVNGAKLGIQASLVTTSTGATVIQFASTAQGAASSFSITGLNDPLQTLRAAQDAMIDVGNPAAGGYTVSSSTNTFTNAVQGVTLTASKPGVTTNVSVSSDTNAISTAVRNLVAAANDAIGTVGYTTAKGADLAAQYGVSSIRQSLLGAVAAGTGTGADYSVYGISMDSTGTLSFDAAAFAAQYAKDPAGTQAALHTTLSGALSQIATTATDTTSGTIGQGVTFENSAITSLNKQISDWNTKLADQKDQLTARYAAMESALSKMKSESSYLSSVFSAMNGTSNSSSGSSGRSSGG